jgi:cytochrome c-type biogenesis protein CcmH
MGFVALIFLVVLSLAALWFLRVRRGLLQAAAAGLLFGAAGYALQGQPDLGGAPASAKPTRDYVALTEARHTFFGSFSAEESWLRMSEGLARGGDTANSVGILQNAVGKYPGSVQLWIGLGNALVDHARGLTPPAELAFRRAAELSPEHPAPRFFYGLALARSGDRPAAVAIWRDLLAKAPPNAGWRPLVEQGVAAFDREPTTPMRQ